MLLTVLFFGSVVSNNELIPSVIALKLSELEEHKKAGCSSL